MINSANHVLSQYESVLSSADSCTFLYVSLRPSSTPFTSCSSDAGPDQLSRSLHILQIYTPSGGDFNISAASTPFKIPFNTTESRWNANEPVQSVRHDLTLTCAIVSLVQFERRSRTDLSLRNF